MGRIAAFGMENPGEMVPYGRLFREQIEILSQSYQMENRREMERRLEGTLVHLSRANDGREGGEGVEQVITEMKSRFGYCDECLERALRHLAGYLLKG